MIYIFDSSTLINLFRYYYKDRFPTLWNNFNDLVESGNIISVREAYNEIANSEDDLSSWAKEHKTKVFLPPESQEEIQFLQTFFQTEKYQQLIKFRNLKRGTPVADPFIITKAKCTENSCIVTEEGFFINSNKVKENSYQIPHICNDLEIDCVNFQKFMEKEKWTF